MLRMICVYDIYSIYITTYIFVPICMYWPVVWQSMSLDKEFTTFIVAIRAGCYAQWN
jgi:hypothetical protein